MHTLTSLTDDLKAMGLTGTDVVMAHSSMKSIGQVVGGADTVLDALTGFFSEGAFLMPTLTWKLIFEPDRSKRVFDVKNSVTDTGLLPEILRKRPGAVRSLHPTHSVAGFGCRAAELIEADRLSPSSCGNPSVWHNLYLENAYIMMIGCQLTSCTFMHAVEEWGDMPVRMPLSEPIAYTVIPESGEPYERRVSCHAVAHTSNQFGKAEAGMRRAGLIRDGRLGDAPVMLLRAKPVFEHVSALLRETPELFLPDGKHY